MRSEGFAIYVCTCDSRAVREELIDSIAASTPKAVHHHDVGDAEKDLLDTLLDSIPDGNGPVMLVGLDRLLDKTDASERFFARLNLRREEWTALRRPVVFWIPRRTLGELTGGAPDFFDWRSDTIDFPDTRIPAAVLGERRWKHGVDPRLSEREQNERQRELKARIKAAEGSWNERLVPILAAWWDELADLNFSRGDVGEALRIHREEQLPLFERLGDVRSRAVTMGKIADVLQARGEYEEALRIRREEELPVFERLGDVSARAFVLYEIAAGLLGSSEAAPEEMVEAREGLIESFGIVEKLGELRGIGNVAILLAQLHSRIDRGQEALPFLAHARSAFERIGDEDALTRVARLEEELLVRPMTDG